MFFEKQLAERLGQSRAAEGQAQMSHTEVKAPPSELFAVDADILDRFQHCFVRIEFVRSVNPTQMCTILHLRQAQAASEDSDV